MNDTSISPQIKVEINNDDNKNMNKQYRSNELISKPKWWHYFFAGEIAGMCGSLICHPFDTTKTEAQMLSKHNQSTISLMRSIIMKHGITSLYNGVLYPFFGFGVLFSIIFGVNGICRNHFIKKNEKDMDRFNRIHLKPTELSMYQLMIGGAFSGGAASIIETPIERVKIWSQIHHTSTMQSTKDLWRKYGIYKGIFHGFGPTLFREIPAFASIYPIYEGICSLLSDPKLHGDKKQIEGWKIFVSGAGSGVGCWTITYPIDVVKTRIQAVPPNTYKNFMDAALLTYKQGGYRIFFNGLMPTIYRAAALHSAVFLVYERALHSIQDITMCHE